MAKPHLLVRVGDSHHGNELRPGQVIVIAADRCGLFRSEPGSQVNFRHPMDGGSWGTLVGVLTPEQDEGLESTGTIDPCVITGIDRAAAQRHYDQTCTDCGGNPGHMRWYPRPAAETYQRSMVGRISPFMLSENVSMVEGELVLSSTLIQDADFKNAAFVPRKDYCLRHGGYEEGTDECPECAAWRARKAILGLDE